MIIKYNYQSLDGSGFSNLWYCDHGYAACGTPSWILKNLEILFSANARSDSDLDFALKISV